MRFAVFIVRHKFGALGNDPLVHRMLHAPMYFHDNGLLHFGARHNPDLLLMVTDFFLSFGFLFRHRFTARFLSGAKSSTIAPGLCAVLAFSSASRFGPWPTEIAA